MSRRRLPKSLRITPGAEGPPHHIYVIAHVRDGKYCAPVKVGISQDCSKRLACLQTASPYPLETVWVFDVPHRNLARHLERGFHEVQGAKALRGEWFDIAPVCAIQLMCLNIYAHLQAVSADIRQACFEQTRAGEAWRFTGKTMADLEGLGR